MLSFGHYRNNYEDIPSLAYFILPEMEMWDGLLEC